MKGNINAVQEHIRRQAEGHPLGDVWMYRLPQYTQSEISDAIEQCVRMGGHREVCESVINKSLSDYGLLPNVPGRSEPRA